MKTSELLAFVTVAKIGNITQASARLNRVQSSISHRLRNLEDRFGITLFDRRKNRISLTAQGKILYEYAIKILELEEDCKKKIASLKHNTPSIRIGLIDCLPPYIASLLIDLSNNIDQCIDICIGNTISLLNSYEKNELDMVIIGSGFSDVRHARLSLFSTDLVLITERNFPTINKISILDGEHFLLSSRKSALMRNCDILIQEGGIMPKRIIECGSYPVLFSSVSEGKGVALVMRCSINRDVRDKIKIHDLHGRFEKFQIELLYRTDSPYIDTLKLTNMITSVFQDPLLHHI
ncbi:LysR family transcriptional regulator [Vibrio mangrovi]|uniref:HTH-type transcriptional regulator YofA n=1 Tax=Vibrio mangrovi TaxID=474394 RepID=A0A1Y6ISP2_9VIBR|nr:LysR family transcriptional regulator [Vibrio mangrovi]MDW6003390.1 LysR family transcriptional regulator [Vibrio mangrovi]SMR99820.1 HTH-type transcriptional regulator YofA [Vibrio mangrovi]